MHKQKYIKAFFQSIGNKPQVSELQNLAVVTKISSKPRAKGAIFSKSWNKSRDDQRAKLAERRKEKRRDSIEEIKLYLDCSGNAVWLRHCGVKRAEREGEGWSYSIDYVYKDLFHFDFHRRDWLWLLCSLWWGC